MASLSDLLPQSLQVGSTILNVGSQLARGTNALTIAGRRKAALNFQADQLEAEAGQSRAVGQVQAQDISRTTALVNSTALARAAASGAGASDQSVMATIARTAGEGGYRGFLAMYEGEAQARIDLMRANAARYEGAVDEQDAQAAKRASNIGAVSTALAGGAKVLSMADKYWAGPETKASSGIDISSIAKSAFTNPDAEDV